MLNCWASLLSPLRGCELVDRVFLGLSPKAICCHRFAVWGGLVTEALMPCKSSLNRLRHRAVREHIASSTCCKFALFVPNNIGYEASPQHPSRQEWGEGTPKYSSLRAQLVRVQRHTLATESHPAHREFEPWPGCCRKYQSSSSARRPACHETLRSAGDCLTPRDSCR